MVDFVGNEQAAVGVTPLGDSTEFIGVDDSAGRIVGAGDDHRLGYRVQLCKHAGCGLETSIGSAG